MCLYPKLILNRKYLPNKKNNGNPQPITDERTKYVPVGCGKCIECMKQKSRSWNVRLQEDIKVNKISKFVTLTFSNEQLSKLDLICNLSGYERDNEIATLAVRRFLERWRKEYGKSLRHWLVTELGHQNTENIHLHGLLFTDKSEQTIKDIWQYGYIFIGSYVNSKTINYITKYINKLDKDHKYYTPKILTSKGIGINYLNSYNSNNNKFNNLKTNELYKNQQGFKMNLPIYYRNKLYTDEEREQLWLNKLDKQIRFVNGEKIDVSKKDTLYYEILAYYQNKNEQLGYGDDKINWEKRIYENQKRNMNRRKRLNNAQK